MLKQTAHGGALFGARGARWTARGAAVGSVQVRECVEGPKLRQDVKRMQANDDED